MRRMKWNRGKHRHSPDMRQILQTPLYEKLDSNLETLNLLFSNTPDLIVRKLETKTGREAAIAYFTNQVDIDVINEHIIKPLLHAKTKVEDYRSIVTVGDVMNIEHWSKVENGLLSGKTILFIEGSNIALALGTEKWPERAIEEPTAESAIKGAHSGFIESGKTNIALIRRYLPNRELQLKEQVVGRRGQTKVSMLYLEDVANPELIEEMETRIRRIDIDAILNTGELEQYVEDHPFSPFPQFQVTERPDTAASQVLQGRIAIVVDKSPGVLVGPMTFTSFFQSIDDYSSRWLVASFIRLLRFTGFLIAVFLPSLYIAVISFHYEVIPINLMISIGESRAQVPIPTILEALLMELILEMLREAGIRLPAPIGQTVGIVGGIVIGEAIVQVGLVSNIMVIVVALTAITTFIMPNQDMAASIRLIRFPMMIIASLMGIIGIVFGLMILVGHLVSIRSLGVPYSRPVAPLLLSDLKDTIIRVPLKYMKMRPRSIKPIQAYRHGPKWNDGEEE
ncbi:spore germination protein [Pseudalkalibacillus sp. Hm43]|uniref:spore germination protein n=1 Tax=Pseudalkalibacillus sp. Hm43 TaxID=3450742 RepID=UPI003F438F91